MGGDRSEEWGLSGNDFAGCTLPLTLFPSLSPSLSRSLNLGGDGRTGAWRFKFPGTCLGTCFTLGAPPKLNRLHGHSPDGLLSAWGMGWWSGGPCRAHTLHLLASGPLAWLRVWGCWGWAGGGALPCDDAECLRNRCCPRLGSRANSVPFSSALLTTASSRGSSD